MKADRTATDEDYNELWKMLKEKTGGLWDGGDAMMEIEQKDCEREVKNKDFPKGKSTE